MKIARNVDLLHGASVLFWELSATRTIWRAIFFFSFRVTIQGVSPFRFPLRKWEWPHLLRSHGTDKFKDSSVMFRPSRLLDTMTPDSLGIPLILKLANTRIVIILRYNNVIIWINLNNGSFPFTMLIYFIMKTKAINRLEQMFTVTTQKHSARILDYFRKYLWSC